MLGTYLKQYEEINHKGQGNYTGKRKSQYCCTFGLYLLFLFSYMIENTNV